MRGRKEETRSEGWEEREEKRKLITLNPVNG